MDVLNEDYEGTGISFTLAGVDYTTNEAWFDDASTDVETESQMKTQLRKGDVKTLNVYTLSYTSAINGKGDSTFPYQYLDNPVFDGIMLDSNGIPGGPDSTYTGKLLVHLSGHFFGLIHTFGSGDPYNVSTVRNLISFNIKTLTSTSSTAAIQIMETLLKIPRLRLFPDLTVQLDVSPALIRQVLIPLVSLYSLLKRQKLKRAFNDKS
jgi:hypothetical protein